MKIILLAIATVLMSARMSEEKEAQSLIEIGKTDAKNRAKLFWLVPYNSTEMKQEDSDYEESSSEYDDGTRVKTASEKLAISITKLTSEMMYGLPDHTLESSFAMSAFSLLTPLAELAVAAEEDTRKQLLAALSIKNINDMKNVFNHLKTVTEARNMPEVVLVMSSRIYVSKSYTINREFKRLCREFFHAEVISVDIPSEQDYGRQGDSNNTNTTTTTKHKMVDTKDTEEELFDLHIDAGRSAQAMLLSKISFKAMWRTPFPARATAKRDFHTSSDEVIQIPTMVCRKGAFMYAKSKFLDAQLLELPYRGNDVAMLIIVPNTVCGLEDLLAKIKKNPKVIDRAYQTMETTSPHPVLVQIPKFTIDTKLNLITPLKHMNVTRIFDEENAHLNTYFSGLKENLYINQASQIININVHEKGTNVNTTNVLRTQKYLRKNKEKSLKRKKFIIDRPFYLSIQVKGIVILNGVFTGTGGAVDSQLH